MRNGVPPVFGNACSEELSFLPFLARRVADPRPDCRTDSSRRSAPFFSRGPTADYVEDEAGERLDKSEPIGTYGGIFKGRRCPSGGPGGARRDPQESEGAADRRPISDRVHVDVWTMLP